VRELQPFFLEKIWDLSKSACFFDAGTVEIPAKEIPHPVCGEVRERSRK
jgi:hypothetical protein